MEIRAGRYTRHTRESKPGEYLEIRRDGNWWRIDAPPGMHWNKGGMIISREHIEGNIAQGYWRFADDRLQVPEGL